MGRKKVAYFRHEYAARRDPKMVEVVEEFGLAGIGFFWGLVEFLHEEDGSTDMSMIEEMAETYHFPIEDARRLVSSEFGLFEAEEGIVYSPQARKNLERAKKTSESRRNAILCRWANSVPPTPEDAPQEPETKQEQSVADPEAKRPPVQYERIKEAWNRICGGKLQNVRALTDQRKAKIRVRVNEFSPNVCQDYEVEDPYMMFERLFTLIMDSPFLVGNNDRGWTADFDWIIGSPQNWIKVIEGRYTNLGKPGATTTKQKENINPNSLWT